jgi:lysophospholipase L1-like esterase
VASLFVASPWRRAGSALLRRVPGYAHVHAQTEPYARAWDTANRVDAERTGPLWVVLGDSTAQAIGAPSPDEGYVGQLRPFLPASPTGEWRVLNLSRSGARLADVLDEQIPALHALASAPDLLTVAVGANDLLRRTPLPRLVALMRRLMGELPPQSVIATLPQGVSGRRAEAVNTIIRDEAPGHGLRVADVWAHTGPPWRGKYASDGFHPNAAGYADWAAAFRESLSLSQ